jgi:hypothetical protein
VAAPSHVVAEPSPVAVSAPSHAAPASHSSGSALAAPGGGAAQSKSSGGSSAAGSPLAAPLAAPAAAAPAAAPAHASTSTTGVVHVDPALRAVVVDGSFRRANDGVLTVTCGQHRIKAGMKDQQTVNVPCGGSVSL